MKSRKIITLIVTVVLCFFLISCASLLSTQGNSPSRVNSVTNDSSNMRVANKINAVSNKPLETKVTEKIYSVRDESAKTEKEDKIDYASFYVDSTKDESIEADQVFEDVLSSKKYDASPFNTLGFNITEEDALIYAKSSALVGDSANEYRMLNYIGYEITEEEIDKAENYSAALTCMREGNYSNAYGLLSKHIDFLDSMQLMNKMIEEELVNFKIGSIGPAGGYIFYDKGTYSDGWRYLEAAPNDLDGKYKWGDYYKSFGTSVNIGTGKSNTEKIILVSGKDGDYAAKACADLIYSDFDDWFLPSKDELNLMYLNLAKRGIGGFNHDYYWSSSELSDGNALIQFFFDGSRGRDPRYINNCVRPVRAF